MNMREPCFFDGGDHCKALKKRYCEAGPCRFYKTEADQARSLVEAKLREARLAVELIPHKKKGD